MLFWCILLVLYLIISFFIDIGKVPFVLRHICNFIPFALGMYLIYRSKTKQRVGNIEKLETRVEELADRYDGLKFTSILDKIKEFENRIAALENKLKG